MNDFFFTSDFAYQPKRCRTLVSTYKVETAFLDITSSTILTKNKIIRA